MKRILLIISLILFVFFVDALATAPIYETFNEGKAVGTSIVVTKPSGVTEGDLLIGCLSSDGGSETHTSPEADSWNIIYKGLSEASGKQTFSIWWKEATASEPETYTFGCGSSEGLYAWIIRISGQYLTDPIHKQASRTGDSAEVSCPAVTTEVEDCLIIRSFGIDHIDVTVDGGWGSETNITVDLSDGSGGTAGGSAWKNQPTAFGTGAEKNFLTAVEEWAGVTIAIQPPHVDLGASRIANASRVDQSGVDDGSVGVKSSYDDKSFSVTNEESAPYGVTFKPDGAKMYVVGTAQDTVFQYSLSTVWDISTASYADKSFIVTETGYPISVFFKPDGTKMYILGAENDKVFQYSLSEAWDVSTASYNDKEYWTNEALTPYSMFFKPDGTKMYLLDDGPDKIYQYSLSEAWDISTASYDDKSFDAQSEDIDAYSIFFSPSGVKIYILGGEYDAVSQYSLSTAWDVSTAGYDGIKFSTSEAATLFEIFLNPDGTKMYAMGYSADTVFQYSLSTAWNKTEDFILATRIYISNQSTERTYKLRWRDSTDQGAFTDVSITGEITFFAVTDLVDGDDLLVGEKLCGVQTDYTWQNGLESEGDFFIPDSGTYSLVDGYYTEFQWALDCNGAEDEHKYEFQLWDVTEGVAVGTCLAGIDMAVPPVGIKWNTKTILKWCGKVISKWNTR